MRRSEALQRRDGGGGRSSGVGLWSIVGGVALVAVAALVVVNLPDIKRYIKISTM